MDFSNATILCLGDIMLDRFAYCETERISPEAPVPVLLLQRTQSILSGVGNVARNIAALGGSGVTAEEAQQHRRAAKRRDVARHIAGAAENALAAPQQ